MTNTNKGRKTNRKVITTLCAVTAAMAIITGITVFSASATSKNKTESKTTTSSQAVTARVADSSSTAQVSADTNTQNAVQTQATQQAVQTQAEPQTAQQDANRYNYTYDHNAASESYAQQAPAAQQETETSSTGDGKLYIPEGEVNDWKIHNAKDGFPIGEYICGQKTLNVVKLDNANYDITVTNPVGENSGVVYNIKAVANGSKMYYTNAMKSNVTYDENRNIIDAQIIDSNHSGTFDASDAGYTWVDTEGTTIFVPWMGF